MVATTTIPLFLNKDVTFTYMNEVNKMTILLGNECVCAFTFPKLFKGAGKAQQSFSGDLNLLQYRMQFT